MQRVIDHHRHRQSRAFIRGLTIALAFPLWVSGEDQVDFNRDIRPILAEKCFRCHGPDENSREASLRLDIADDEEGPFAPRAELPAIAPGSPDGSALWFRVTTKDEGQMMPPSDANLDPLNAAEREKVKRWILQGAEYKDYWSFRSPQKESLPNAKNSDWAAQRIDRFVMARLQAEKLQPGPRADRRILIRRVTFDLTGLPPTRAEIQDFLRDESPDAYERLVDRLIASPRYGEHMAKYWLDLVRFADTNGIHHDHYREMTPYRDWVIRAFNDNLSFDTFIVDQIAGDLYPQPTLNQQIASGFNRLHLVIDKGTAIPAESYTRNVIDRVTAVGTAFLGLTVGCAVCHDHKYDPVTQKDFYRLFAFFNNIDATPETPGQSVHPPFVRVPDPAQRKRLQVIDEQIQARIGESEAIERQLNSATTDVSNSQPAERVKQLKDELQLLKSERTELENNLPVSLVMKERAQPRPAFVLIRGAYDQPGEKVERGTPSFLPPMTLEGDVATRMDLARWLIDPQHPLTARVTVNRFWQQFFGVGLVKTSEDFGTQGEWPSHPRLLDDLVSDFIQADWDVKMLVKAIVCSQTYQQSSRADPDLFRADPQNRLLARGSRFRLDAEMIRDQILAVSGLLNGSMYGRSVKPPQPPNLWKNVSMVSSSTYSFAADRGSKIHRRSLYSFWKRALPPPQMTIFDAPTRESCVARRERTNTPLQALVLMNEAQYFKAAKHFAQRLMSRSVDDEQRLRVAYELVTSRLPDAHELSRLRRGLEALRSIYQRDLSAAKAMTAKMDEASDAHRIDIAAYAMLINSLFNLDVTKTRE